MRAVMMNVLALFCIAMCLAVCEGRLDDAAMRKALNSNPMWSHERNEHVMEPQNFNIILPVSDPDIPKLVAPPKKKAVPVKAESHVKPGRMRHQNRPGTPVAAGKPVRHQERVLGQKAPPRGSIDHPILRTAASKPKTNRQVNNKKQKCSVQIPSFLLPDPNPEQIGSNLRCPSFLLPGPDISPDLVNLMIEHWTGLPTPSSDGRSLNKVRSQISQVEFEQKCLIPALRAYVVGGLSCRSRELTVYLEWLLYLRQRLFNI